MKTQEVMLNDNINLNFKYSNKIYKVKINVHNGLIIVEELQDSNEDTEIKKIIMLSDKKPCEYTEIQQEIKEIETNGKNSKPKRKSNRKRV